MAAFGWMIRMSSLEGTDESLAGWMGEKYWMGGRVDERMIR